MNIDKDKFSETENITEKSVLKDKYNLKIRSVDLELLEEIQKIYPEKNRTDLFNLIMKNYLKEYLSEFNLNDPRNGVAVPFLIAAVADALSGSIAIDVNESWKTVIATKGAQILSINHLDDIIRSDRLDEDSWINLRNPASYPEGLPPPSENCIAVCEKLLGFFDSVNLDKDSWLYKQIKSYADIQLQE